VNYVVRNTRDRHHTPHRDLTQYTTACSSHKHEGADTSRHSTPWKNREYRQTLLLLARACAFVLLFPRPIDPPRGQVIRLLLRQHGWWKEGDALERLCVFCYFFGTTTPAFWAASARSAKEKTFHSILLLAPTVIPNTCLLCGTKGIPNLKAIPEILCMAF
jgi:hypothetical protein